MGDFASRRLPEPFRHRWDLWMQEGFSRLRLHHADWTERYLEAPVWSFVLAQDVMGACPWIGIVMPSVDGVGRYFPFVVARELPLALDPVSNADWTNILGWWHCAASAAMAGLDQDDDATRFDQTLANSFGAGAAQSEATSPFGWPAPGQSLWLSEPWGAGARVLAAGLPTGLRFDALFGFSEPMDCNATDLT